MSFSTTIWVVPHDPTTPLTPEITVPSLTTASYFQPTCMSDGVQFYTGTKLTEGGSLTISPFTFVLENRDRMIITYPILGATEAAAPSTTSPFISTQTAANTSQANNTSQSPPKAATSSNAPPKPDNGLAPGPVAGIAIGCLVCGALLSSLFIWFCIGRRRILQKNRKQEANTVALINRREKEPTVGTISIESGSPTLRTMETNLPQPLEDKIISGEIAKIDSSIKNHVHSFYHSGRVGPNAIDIDDLLGLGNDLPISTGLLSTLLGNSDTREVALRFCIAWVMISRMKLSSRPDKTFLPPEVAECFQSMLMTTSVQPMVLMKWRASTAQLLRSSYGQTSSAPSDLRGPNIEMALKILDPVLVPYTDSRVDSKLRRKNLEEIFKRASVFAFTLFSQPGTFDYDWREQEGVLSGNLCIFPALVQVIDEKGQSLTPPRAFSEAVVRRLDS